jgi:hypothetical protein
MMRGLPAGATLILVVGDKEKFISRSMVGAPNLPEARVTEHLLDGQQRLTALWRAFHNDYDEKTYLVRFEVDEETGEEHPVVTGQARWYRGDVRYPVWVDDPTELASRGFFPLPLLRPGEMGRQITEWCDAACADDVIASRELERRVHRLREEVITFNIPFLALDASTPKDVALDVFIKMNTSFVRLTAFDILVAQIEAEAGESLHDMLGKLKGGVPALSDYLFPETLILDVGSLREDRGPTQASYNRLDTSKLVNEWSEVIEGIAWAIELLQSERVFDGARLPTTPVVRVLAALHPFVPPALDEKATAIRLLRKYLWRAFLTRRYESSAATASLQDFRALRDVLQGDGIEAAVPIFDEGEFPLPAIEDLKRANWPKTKDTLGRAILAISIKAGARDLADDEEARRENLQKREYHHLFPEALLLKDGGLEEREAYAALNCALITWNTNRHISAKEPLMYLRERVERGGLGHVLGAHEIKTRLASHAVPFDELNVGGYEALSAHDRQSRIRSDYTRFLEARAKLLLDPIAQLCSGARWPSS